MPAKTLTLTGEEVEAISVMINNTLDDMDENHPPEDYAFLIVLLRQFGDTYNADEWEESLKSEGLLG